MPDDALNLAQILWDEQCALKGEALPSAAVPIDYRSIPQITRRPRSFTELGEDDLPEIYRALLASKRHALCLSGGGIRSAAFALGAIECLASYAAPAPDRSPGGDYAAQPPDDAARVPLLQQFDYLSTVSGGGYLGSWLSAWLLRIRQAEPAGTGKADRVIAALAAPPSAGEAIEPVSNLRSDTHYLAPKFSALSPDLWSGIAAVVRNLLLNWLVVLPPLVLLVLFTEFTRCCTPFTTTTGSVPALPRRCGWPRRRCSCSRWRLRPPIVPPDASSIALKHSFSVANSARFCWVRFAWPWCCRATPALPRPMLLLPGLSPGSIFCYLADCLLGRCTSNTSPAR
jgi:hypothetical protein